MRKFSGILGMLVLSSCGFEQSADQTWLAARDAVYRGYQHVENEISNCFQHDGCSIRGPRGHAGLDGQDGIDGLDGAVGAAGQDGTDGLPGEAGPQGVAGEDGLAGAAGAQGPRGESYALILTAAKSYGPSTWYDASWSGDSVDVVVPEFIPVLAGNAGNHTLELTIGSAVCVYKGGADVSKPLSPYNQTQVNKGQLYWLESGCVSGDTLSAAAITMVVNNGDSTTTTVAQAKLVLQ